VFVLLCNAKQGEQSSKSSLMTIEFNRSVSTTENKVPLIPAALWSHRIAGRAGSVQASIWNWPLRGWSEPAPHSQQGLFTQWEHLRCWVLADVPVGTYNRCSRGSAGYSQVLCTVSSCREAQPCQAIRGCWAAMLPILVF